MFLVIVICILIKQYIISHDRFKYYNLSISNQHA